MYLTSISLTKETFHWDIFLKIYFSNLRSTQCLQHNDNRQTNVYIIISFKPIDTHRKRLCFESELSSRTRGTSTRFNPTVATSYLPSVGKFHSLLCTVRYQGWKDETPLTSENCLAQNKTEIEIRRKKEKSKWCYQGSLSKTIPGRLKLTLD